MVAAHAFTMSDGGRGGRISGILSLSLGGLSLLAVLCFRYPALLTTPESP